MWRTSFESCAIKARNAPFVTRSPKLLSKMCPRQSAVPTMETPTLNSKLLPLDLGFCHPSRDARFRVQSPLYFQHTPLLNSTLCSIKEFLHCRSFGLSNRRSSFARVVFSIISSVLSMLYPTSEPRLKPFLKTPLFNQEGEGRKNGWFEAGWQTTRL